MQVRFRFWRGLSSGSYSLIVAGQHRHS